MSATKSLGGLSTVIGGSFGKLDAAIQVLNVAFPNLSKDVSATSASIKAGSGVVKGLPAGFSALSETMLPIIAIAAAVGVAIHAIVKASRAAE